MTETNVLGIVILSGAGRLLATGLIMTLKEISRLSTIAAAFLLTQPAFAWDWAVTTRVNSIEATYMPGGVVFTAKDNAGSCAAGSLLGWNIRGATPDERIANASSIYTLLLTALSTGKSITIYGNNNGCSIDHVYINYN